MKPGVEDKESRTQTTSRSAPKFTPTADPQPLSSSELEACDPPTADHPEKVRCYAVGRINGVLYRTGENKREATGAEILYVSPDGEVAFVRRYYVAENEWKPIDPYSYADPDADHTRKMNADTFKLYQPALEDHPYLKPQ